MSISALHLHTVVEDQTGETAGAWHELNLIFWRDLFPKVEWPPTNPHHFGVGLVYRAPFTRTIGASAVAKKGESRLNSTSLLQKFFGAGRWTISPSRSCSRSRPRAEIGLLKSSKGNKVECFMTTPFYESNHFTTFRIKTDEKIHLLENICRFHKVQIEISIKTAIKCFF